MTRGPIRRLAFGGAIGFALIGAASVNAGIHLSGSQDTLVVTPGQTFTVELALRQPDSAFNGFDAAIHFDPARLTFATTSPLAAQRGPLMTAACSNTFHVFKPRPDSLLVTLVLLCSETSVHGPGVIYQVKFTAANLEGWTTLTFGPSTRFYLGGPEVTPLEARSIVVRIGNPVTAVRPADLPEGLAFLPPSPNPAQGARSIMLAFALPSRDDVRFELFDALGRSLAARASEPFAAGAHRVQWGVPGLPPGRYSIRMRTGMGHALTQSWVGIR